MLALIIISANHLVPEAYLVATCVVQDIGNRICFSGKTPWYIIGDRS